MEFVNISDIWLELNRDKMIAFNYYGDWRCIEPSDIDILDIREFNSWHDLYVNTGYCPIIVDIRYKDVWVSPDGKYYNGDAHDNRAEEILDIIYGETNVDWYEDRLEELGWIRATTSLMWNMRLEGEYWNNKCLTTQQYTALCAWYNNHGKNIPQNILIIHR